MFYLIVPTRDAAQRRGYDVALYENGNEGLIIGDYSSLATDLFEKGRISEGHYNELVNVLMNAWAARALAFSPVVTSV